MQGMGHAVHFIDSGDPECKIAVPGKANTTSSFLMVNLSVSDNLANPSTYLQEARNS